MNNQKQFELNINEMTKKHIVLTDDLLDSEIQLIAGNLPYEKPKNENDLRRPVGIEFMIDNKYNDLRKMNNHELYVLGQNIVTIVKMHGPDKPMMNITENVDITFGDFLIIINDEFHYRNHHNIKH